MKRMVIVDIKKFLLTFVFMVNLLCVNFHTILTLGCLPIPDSALTIKGFFIFFQEIKDSQSGIIGALNIIKKTLDNKNEG